MSVMANTSRPNGLIAGIEVLLGTALEMDTVISQPEYETEASELKRTVKQPSSLVDVKLSPDAMHAARLFSHR